MDSLGWLRAVITSSDTYIFKDLPKPILFSMQSISLLVQYATKRTRFWRQPSEELHSSTFLPFLSIKEGCLCMCVCVYTPMHIAILVFDKGHTTFSKNRLYLWYYRSFRDVYQWLISFHEFLRIGVDWYGGIFMKYVSTLMVGQVIKFLCVLIGYFYASEHHISNKKPNKQTLV